MYIYPHAVFETAARLQGDLLLSDVFLRLICVSERYLKISLVRNLIGISPSPFRRFIKTASPTPLFLENDKKSGVSKYSYR